MVTRRTNSPEHSVAPTPVGLALASALALLSCGGQPSSTDAGACEHALVPGTVDDVFAFAPLDEGADLPMHLGPQGGFHVYASLRARGVQKAGSLEVAVLDATDQPLTGVRLFPLATVKLDDITCGWERVGDPLIFSALVIDPLRGLPARVRWRLSASGEEVQRTVTLR